MRGLFSIGGSMWLRIVLYESILFSGVYLYAGGFADAGYLLLILIGNFFLLIPMFPLVCLMVKLAVKIPYGANSSMIWLTIVTTLINTFICMFTVSVTGGDSISELISDQIIQSFLIMIFIANFLAIAWAKDSFSNLKKQHAQVPV